MTEHDQKSLTAQQKAKAALESVRAARPIDEIAQEYGVATTELRQWEQNLIGKASILFGEDRLAVLSDDAVRQGAPFFDVRNHFPCDATAVASAVAPCLQTAIAGENGECLVDQDQRESDSISMRAEKVLHDRIEQLTSEQMQINEALVFTIFEHKRAEEALQQSTNMLQQLLAHQEHIKEEERKRIAREIHDDLGQNLMALRIDISMLHARTARAHPRLHEWVGVALNNIDTTIKSVRSIINDLRPFELELGLQAAVEWQLKGFERMSGVACRLSIAETAFGYELGDERILAIFRILQESLSNIVRHSLATEAEVTLSRDERTFSMTVKDNGVGVYPDDRRKVKSFGIVGIKERLSSLGGELIIESSAGNGTVLSIFIPV